MNLRSLQAGEGGPAAGLARAGLSTLACAFGTAARLRGALYDARLLRSRPLPVPVVSVGNLVAGGTGKTPFVAWLASRALAAGRHPGILSRGYGPRPAGTSLSDEGALLEEMLRGAVPQVEDPDRLRGGTALLSAHPETDLVLLDDGFQHRRLARDADLVLLDATNPFGFGRLLPRGLLREPPSALARADAVVVTRAERLGPAALAALLEEVGRRAPRARRAVAEGRPRALLGPEGSERPVGALTGVAVFAHAGIGNPAAFEASLRDLGARVVGTWWVPDHHDPTDADAASLVARARAAGADLVVVTRKDLVKWRARRGLPSGFCALDVETDVVEGAQDLVDLVLGAGRARAAGAHGFDAGATSSPVSRRASVRSWWSRKTNPSVFTRWTT